jgi:hypothetical protein
MTFADSFFSQIRQLSSGQLHLEGIRSMANAVPSITFVRDCHVINALGVEAIAAAADHPCDEWRQRSDNSDPLRSAVTVRRRKMAWHGRAKNKPGGFEGIGLGAVRMPRSVPEVSDGCSTITISYDLSSWANQEGVDLFQLKRRFLTGEFFAFVQKTRAGSVACGWLRMLGSISGSFSA